MISKYQIFVLMSWILITSGANAVYNYSISVGTHEVSFNTSSPIWKITYPSPYVTDLGYESRYSPTYSLGSADNPIYTTSTTSLTSRQGHSGPSLEVEVRDFENPIPWNVMTMEADTLSKFLKYVPLGNRSTYYIGNGVIANHEKESFGALIEWPSDQVEIIITGSLPSIDIWENISDSLELVR